MLILQSKLQEKFIKAFDRLMQKEGIHLSGQGKKFHSRDFYLFSTSFVSFNFEMVFPWIFMNSHYELNHHPTYIQDHPLKLWLDYGVEHRGRKLENDKIEPTLEFTESVASRENEDDLTRLPTSPPTIQSGSTHSPFSAKIMFVHGQADFRKSKEENRQYESRNLVARKKACTKLHN